MREDTPRGSDRDLERILEEYSAINQNRVQRTNRSNLNQTQAQNISSDVSRNNTRPVERDTISSANDIPINRRNTQPKKFVLHIDESVLDTQNSEPARKPQSNSNGIYFSNYQKNKSVGNQSSAQAPAGKPLSKQTADSESVRKNTQQNTSRPNKKTVGVKEALIFLAVIIISTTLLSYIGITCIGDMLAINRSEETVEVTIPEGADYKEVVDILHDNDLIKNKLFCTVFTKYRKFDEETFNGGKYYLTPSMGLEGMLRGMIVSPFSADTIKLSFPEGFTVKEIFEKLDKYNVCEANKLYSTIKSNYSYDFFKEIEEDPNRYLKLEGYMFPDTYDFFVGADTNYVIKKFLDNFESKWTPEYQARADKLGYTCDEIITIASIIQKEADNVEQMKLISSVLHNRLNNPSRFPTIDCDSTRLYASKFMPENVGLIYADHYDTYSNRGLPPGPICNPGMDAIKAALYPEDSDYYFFVHDITGKIYMAETLREHELNEAIKEKVNEEYKNKNDN